MSDRPGLFVIGAGPVAIALSGALRVSGVPVLGLWARDANRAREAGNASGVVASSGEFPAALGEADVVLLAVRDDAISRVAKTLVEAGAVDRRPVMLHCSGVLSATEAFADVAGSLQGWGAVHPLRAIPDGAAAIHSMAGTVFGIQGDPNGLARARALVDAVGGESVELAEEQMAAYHAAAVIASNGLVGLLDAACALLERTGIPEQIAIRGLVSLAAGTLDNVGARGLRPALTGPIRRGDSDTVARHLTTLDSEPDLRVLYRVLGRRLVALARDCEGARADRLDAIAALLESVESDA